MLSSRGLSLFLSRSAASGSTGGAVARGLSTKTPDGFFAIEKEKNGVAVSQWQWRYHGRTVHSKADGLRIFRKVRVDLIAPKELEMPESAPAAQIVKNIRNTMETA